ncbi:MAG: phosphatase PAP2 family protein [Lachnospiraceae bacterium]|nr:phosphatase PAP2 family protein [Lachnospiraceae bacterium]
MNVLLAGSLGALLDTVFANLDMSIFAFFGNLQSGFLTTIAKIFTAMGSTKYVALFGLLGLILIFFRRTRKVGLALVFAIIIGTLITNIVLKPMALRVRPYNTLQHIPEFWNWYVGAGQLCESDYCFPSGHTTGAFEIAMVLCLTHISARKKRVAWIFPLVAVITGASRIYLMVHYATDVFAGVIVGCFAGVIGYLISNAICKWLKGRRVDKSFDAARKFKKGISHGGAAVAIVIGWVLIFGISYVTAIGEGGPDTVRCAYNADYDCQNEAQVDSKKYPAIDGKEYCKIHWKEISAAFAETGTIPEPTTEEPPAAAGTEPVLGVDIFTFYDDPAITAFRDNFGSDMPVKMRYYKAQEIDEVVTDESLIQRCFEALKKVKVTKEDTSGEVVTDSALSITFIMEDETQYYFGFDSPGKVLFGQKYYIAENTEELYQIMSDYGISEDEEYEDEEW